MVELSEKLLVNYKNFLLNALPVGRGLESDIRILSDRSERLGGERQGSQAEVDLQLDRVQVLEQGL